MKKIAIIVAAGSGTRMQSGTPKQFLQVGGKPLLWYTLKAFFGAFADMEVLLVLPPDHRQTGRQLTEDFPGQAIRVVAGGSTRFQSVSNGLEQIKEEEAIVFVHDGVRCLITPELIRRCYTQAMEKGSAIPVIEATDSLRVLHSGKEHKEHKEPMEDQESSALDRRLVRIVQTPQTFRSAILQSAFSQPYREAFTDEASVVESLNIPVYLIEGEATNLKITRPIDMIIAEKLLQERG